MRLARDHETMLALDRVVCGAVKTSGRYGYKKFFWCEAEDSPRHRYWECKRLVRHDSPAIQETNSF